MKKAAFFLTVIALMLATFTSCHKTTSTVEAPVSMDELKVSSEFNWESSRSINLTVGINMLPANIGKLTKISVYSSSPVDESNLLISGAAGYGSPFEYTLTVPSLLKKIYLKVEDGAGFSQIDSVQVSSTINHMFTQNLLKNVMSTATDPDCSGATPEKTLSGNQSYTINNGTWYVTGTFTGSINFGSSGASINVCGTFNPQNINNMGTGCFIAVTQGGTFQMNNSLVMGNGSRLTLFSNSHISLGGLNMNGTTPRIINYGNDFVINSQFSPNGSLENYGSMVLNGGLNVNSTATLFVTTGSLTINGNLNLNTSITNNGSIEVFGQFNLNGGTLYHNCKLIVHQDMNLSSGNLTMNGAYLKETGSLQINSGATILLKNNSMISTSTYQQNTEVQGTGGRSTIKISTSGLINGQSKVNGSIEMLTPTGTLTAGNSANFINGAKITKISTPTNILPVSACNPEGVGGTPPVPDADADGVPDNLDNYPNDATRAFDNYYPSKTSYGSLAFEDLWPAKGDYDLNDLVVDYRYRIVTNAQNKVVDINPNFYVRAAGATLSSGFGIQVDGVLAGQVASVSGNSLHQSYISVASNGVENNQSKAVIIVFDNFNHVIHRAGSNGFYNTDPTLPQGYGDTVKVNIHLASPLAQSIVGSPPYNPFLIKGMNRPVEIHLADHTPTSMANTGLFGTDGDNSIPGNGRYYKTSTNLPWALNFPAKFEYTDERIPIIQGYNHFATWSQSSGSQYPDWYLNQSGYRNPTKIYQ
ncbi:MAG: LruC domain-containing protein [Bacteroidales bacterium]